MPQTDEPGLTADPLADLLGESPGIVALRNQVRRLLARWTGSRRLPPLLLRGETGSGKGLLAAAIHRTSARGGGPFVAVNCAAVPPTLLEAEFFGVERGAFTDAREPKAGLFEAAHGGTLFLDEVGLLPGSLQAKLLTVLDDHCVRRLGSTRTRTVDIGLTAATSLDLEAAIREGRFREDLLHRLSVVTLRLPPLRERGSDVLLLAVAYLARAASDYGLPRKSLSAEARQALVAYHWPGNVRELANALERALLLSESPMITAEDLGLADPQTAAVGDSTAQPPRLRIPHAREGDGGAGESRARGGERGLPIADVASDGQPASIRRSLQAFERQQLVDALVRARWNVARAAEMLGIPRNTLRYRIAKYGLEPDGLTSGNAGDRHRARRSPVSAEPIGQAETATVPERADSTAPDGRAARWNTRVVFLRAELVVPPGKIASWSLRRGLEALADKVHAFSGMVTARRETGLDAAFGLEPAEDAPSWAANAALAIQKTTQRLQATDPGLRVTVALHAAVAAVELTRGTPTMAAESLREIDATLTGLMDRGEPGTVLVCAAVAPLLQRRFLLEACRPIAATPAG
jgi:DNA-binding NtrC family response regulator